MEFLSLLGIVLGITCFVVCIFKGINLFLSAIISSIIIMLLSGMPVMSSIHSVWVYSLGEFLKSTILIFVLSSLFGKTMADGRISRSLAVACAKLIRKSKPQNQKLLTLLFVPMMYILLNIIGVSGYVIVFTVLVMARDLFQELDVPWKFYSYGGSAAVISFGVGGSLQITNIMVSEQFGTPLTSAMVLSLIGFFAGCLSIFIMAKLDLAKAQKNGEGFMPTGKDFRNEDLVGGSEVKEELPPVLLSLIPMVTVFVTASVFNQVIIALVIGILLNIVLSHKYITDLNTTVSEGIVSGFVPVINVAATAAITAVISATPGFAIISDFFYQLPPLYGGIGLLALLGFLTASPTGPLPAVGPEIFGRMVSSGIPETVAHRFISASLFTCAGPHNPGVINTIGLAKLEFKKAVLIYIKVSLVSGAVQVLTMFFCYSIGIAF